MDLENESVYGNVTHTLTPLHGMLNSFVLDAEDMVIIERVLIIKILDLIKVMKKYFKTK